MLYPGERMLKSITSTLAFFLMVTAPLSAFAEFESREKLFEALNKSGIEEIIEIRGSSGMYKHDPDLIIHSASGAGKFEESELRHYANATSFNRLAELDYIAMGAFRVNYKIEAYQVGEVFLCYRDPLNPVESVMGKKNSNPFASCYIFPMKIKDVVEQLKASMNPVAPIVSNAPAWVTRPKGVTRPAKSRINAEINKVK